MRSLFGAATTDVAYTLVVRLNQTHGVWRHRVNAERKQSEVNGLSGAWWPIKEIVCSARCDDEYHETLESEWCK